MKLTPLILLLLPLLSFTQDYNYEQRYFGIGTELDARNAVEGSYNGIIKSSYTAESFRVEAFYETHPDINYESVGLNAGVLINRNNVVKLPLLAQLSTIHRPAALVPSLGIVGGLEVHLGQFILQANLEGKWRSDFEKVYGTKPVMRLSGRIGVMFKI